MIDWKTIQTEYITTDTSYRRLGEKYGLSYKTIGRQAQKEGWVESRRLWREKTLNKALEKAGNDEADRLTALRRTADSMACEIERMAACELPGYTGKPAEIKAVREMTAAVKDMAAVIRSLYGLATPQERDEQEIVRQKMQMEWEKLRLTRQKETETSTGEGGGVVEIAALVD